MLGYSHAGEGGDNVMWGFKKRVDDRDRIPDCRYYHLLMGVNDASGTKDDASADANAARIAKGLMERVDSLLARPGTEKVFLGTIFPCVSDNPNVDAKMVERFRLRDLTASKINGILRREIPEKYGDKVVLIEYEKVLRARDDWKKIIRLHPTQEGGRRSSACIRRRKATRSSARSSPMPSARTPGPAPRSLPSSASKSPTSMWTSAAAPAR